MIQSKIEVYRDLKLYDPSVVPRPLYLKFITSLGLPNIIPTLIHYNYNNVLRTDLSLTGPSPALLAPNEKQHLF